MQEPRLIAIEGAIGAGKTTLTRLLAKQFNAKMVLEVDEDNPFIDKFYEDRSAFAFQTQVFFLLNRYHQYQKLVQGDLFNSVVITDYLFQRDRIFAGLNLEGHELHLYEQLYNLIKIKIPKPDLVIFLQAETPVLHTRVEKRGRRFEQNMELGYLEEVNRAFNNFFFYYSETPLLVINTNKIDLAGEKFDIQELIHKINNHRIGREYYNPLGS
ncbi:MAG: deoxynucleoside kinase [Nitrospinaceae bacterium]|nr:deoxynucleoside kinase [Nitrospinaceae bacterium]NIR56146.1 deoxynucleoside kinase [Nitrospinaceae bacterium]NIS86601.1 deoxynucleoside kinase [Nitrospinaceae bacterium]NIT83431.1 deoxynucleoside kinase [Nitrospinaceae bacterium]NIU45640.1 deoxynucleoside kinase [Nitrospinaceae bacterium]